MITCDCDIIEKKKKKLLRHQSSSPCQAVLASGGIVNRRVFSVVQSNERMLGCHIYSKGDLNVITKCDVTGRSLSKTIVLGGFR